MIFRLSLEPKRTVTMLALAAVVVVLLSSSLLWVTVTWRTGEVPLLLHRTFKLFDIRSEGNLSSLYNFGLWLFASALLFIIGRQESARMTRFATHWRALSLIFLVLAIDEVTGVHEKFSWPLRSLFDLGGILYHSWILVPMVLFPFFVIAFWRFLIHLPANTMAQFVLAFLLFVSGAVGPEVVEGRYHIPGAPSSNFLQGLMHIQEGLELFGLVVFIRALLFSVSETEINLCIRLREQVDSGG
jgi:hypothetical protein